jgi:hypothetical protein
MRLIRDWAWLGLPVIAGLVSLFGVGDLAGGISADPGITESVTGGGVDAARQAAPRVADLADVGMRTAGAAQIALGLAWAGLILAGVRRRIRWAWVVSWTMPLWVGLILVIWLTTERVAGTPLPAPMLSGPVFLLLSVLLLAAAWPAPELVHGTDRRQAVPSADVGAATGVTPGA